MTLTSSAASTPAPSAGGTMRGPVFIGGLSHSGKTPLRIALGAHPQLSMTRGTGMWTNYHARYGSLARRRNARRCIDAMSRDRAIIALEVDFADLQQAFTAGPATYARLFALVHEHHARRVGASRWGDQLRRVEHYADPIFAAFPDARMIHMVRDPRARRPDAIVGDLRGGLGRETGRWTASVDLAARNAARHPGRYRIVRYEDLLARPEAVLRHLSAFIGEAYDDAMLRALRTTTAATAQERSGRSATRRAASTHAFVDRYAGDHLVALGYAVAPPQGPAPRFDGQWLIDRGAMVLHHTWVGRRPVPGAPRRAQWRLRTDAACAAVERASLQTSVIDGDS